MFSLCVCVHVVKVLQIYEMLYLWTRLFSPISMSAVFSVQGCTSAGLEERLPEAILSSSIFVFLIKAGSNVSVHFCGYACVLWHVSGQLIRNNV